ncbi:MAG: hypothetical protein ACRDP2_07250, partial [Nocardioidaceae bacterium]
MRRPISVLSTVALMVGLLGAVQWSAATAAGAPASQAAASQAPASQAAAADPPLPLPEPVVHPIQVTGPPSERLNLIIM